jgi:hypothetical protein
LKRAQHIRALLLHFTTEDTTATQDDGQRTKKQVKISFTSFIAEECLEQFIFFSVKMPIEISLHVLMLRNVSVIKAESQQQISRLEHQSSHRQLSFLLMLKTF